MGLFNKNKKVNNAATDAPKKGNGKKNKDTLASLIPEQVINTAWDNLNANCSDLSYMLDGEKAFVCALFDTNVVGGLVDKNDQDKGSIVEAINGGVTRIYASVPMLEENRIIYLLDRNTVLAMGEYKYLREVKYDLVWFFSNGNYKFMDEQASLDDLQSIYSDRVAEPAEEFMRKFVYSQFGTDDAESSSDEDDGFYENDYANNSADNSNSVVDNNEQSADEPFSDESDDVNDADDYDDSDLPVDDEPSYSDINGNNYDDYDDHSDNDENLNFDDSSNYQNVNFVDNVSDNIDDIDFDGADDSDVDDVYIENEEPVPSEQVQAVIIRQFYSKDLDLEVTTEPFDNIYVPNPYNPFTEIKVEGSDWFQKQHNAIVAQANASLRKLHEDNMDKLRQAYISQVSQVVDELNKKLSSDNPDTDSGKVMSDIEKHYQDNLNLKQQMIDAKTQQLKDEWNKTLDVEAQRAAENARKIYEQRYKDQHMSELNAIPMQVQNMIEADRTERIQKLNESRKETARKQYDHIVSLILENINDAYARMMVEEEKVVSKWTDRINEIDSQCREADIQRIRVLEAEQKHSKELADIEMQYKAKYEALQAELNVHKKATENDVATIRQNFDTMMAEKAEHYRISEEALKQQNEQLRQQLEMMTSQIDKIAEDKDKEYKTQINELRNQRDALNDRMDFVENANKKSGFLMMSIAIVACIAAIAIGFILGTFVRVNGAGNSTAVIMPQSAYVQQIDNNTLYDEVLR